MTIYLKLTVSWRRSSSLLITSVIRISAAPVMKDIDNLDDDLQPMISSILIRPRRRHEVVPGSSAETICQYSHGLILLYWFGHNTSQHLVRDTTALK